MKFVIINPRTKKPISKIIDLKVILLAVIICSVFVIASFGEKQKRLAFGSDIQQAQDQ